MSAARAFNRAYTRQDFFTADLIALSCREEDEAFKRMSSEEVEEALEAHLHKQRTGEI